jgi:HD-GYP domain-containing protein (c-di-GMP phosphodiesterase class II)
MIQFDNTGTQINALAELPSEPLNSATQKDDYKALLRISTLLSAEKNLHKLLSMIMDETKRLLNADRSTLFLVDHERNVYYSEVAIGMHGTIELPLGVGLAGTAATKGEIINVTDAQNDPRYYGDIEGYVTRTILTIPLRNHADKIIGIVQAINKNTGIFDARDEEILGAFASVAAVAIENTVLRRDFELMFDSMVNVMAASIDARDMQSAGHSQRVARYAEEMARLHGMSEDQQRVVRLAGLLHDYGKIGIPDAVLCKPGPGRLSETEFKIMQSHVVKTRQILDKVYFVGPLKRIPIIAGQHHERLNGRGYPLGLHDVAIEFEAKILAVADVYDAITVRRYYREPMPVAEAITYLHSITGTELDQECVYLLQRVVAQLGEPHQVFPFDTEANPLGSTDKLIDTQTVVTMSF